MKQGIVKRKIYELLRVRENINTENTKEEVKGKNSEEENIKIPKCIRKNHVETVYKKIKESSSEEEEIGIRNCRRTF